MYPSVQQQIEQITANAKSAFAEHRIEVRLAQGLFRNWCCAKPGTGVYAFNVSTEPGRLFVTGDIGTMVWERCDDMIAWARGAVDSLGYFAEKVVGEIPTKQWDADAARDWLDREKQDVLRDFADSCGEDENPADEPYVKKRLEKIAYLRQQLDDLPDEHYFCREVYESGLVDGCDWPNLKCYNPSFLWCREAVRWLLAHLDDEGKVKL